VDYRNDFLNQREAFKLELPHITGEGADLIATTRG
jgi:hypothetical protein